jgi:NAD(P)-dependent dehydrogenase (short-subunit alcohol dehydrogenase family)
LAAIELRNRPIAITGASSGIGRATALACARAGMPVALAARRADKLGGVAEEIAALGGRSIVVACDVTRTDDCQRLVDETLSRFGSIYAIFANAGYGLEKAVHDTSDAELRAIFETNFFGTLNTIRPALIPMRRARSGHILICSSVVGKFSAPYFGAYCATKGAQSDIGRSMRLELAPEGIQVSTVHPIGTRTEFFDVSRANSGGTSMMDHTPDAFMQTPERVARGVVACLHRPRAEVWTSTLPRLGAGLLATFPSLGDIVMRQWLKRRR